MSKTLSDPYETTALKSGSRISQCRKIRAVFAFIASVIITMLMNTAVFAIDGTASNPHIVTTGTGLVNASKHEMDYYIKLGNDIEINENTGNIKPTYFKHVDLDGHTIRVTNSSFIFMYTNGSPTPKKFEMYNGNIEIDVPKQSTAPCMINSNMGHIIMRDITMDVTLQNDNGVVFFNENASGSTTNDSLELYNCVINDHSPTVTKVIKARPMLQMENTTITCDNHSSYALIIMQKAKFFNMMNCRLNGKIGFDVYKSTYNVNTYIDDWNQEADEEGVIIGLNKDSRVVYKEDIAYGNYIAETRPMLISSPKTININCGDKLYVETKYRHAKTCEWHLAFELNGKYTEIPKKDWRQDITIAQSTTEHPDYISSFKVPNAGGWLDGYWLCATVSYGNCDTTTEWVQININKTTLSEITIYDLDPPTQGKALDYEMTFGNSAAQCIENSSVGYYYDARCQLPYTTPNAGQTCYVAVIIDLKSNYAAFKADANGEIIAELNWYGVDSSNIGNPIFSKNTDYLVAIYPYTIPVPNGGAGERLERVYTGVKAPSAGEELSTQAYNTGIYVPRGYRVRKVEWSQNDNGYPVAKFTIDADIGYFIDEKTKFFLNGAEVEPDEITDSGTAGNKAVASLVFSEKGDVNADGTIDRTDAALVLKHISGTKLLAGENLNCADINNDSECDIRDVVKILNVV